jgi:hypothetical protein
VYLLLKSSDFVAFDLERAWAGLRDEDEGEEEDDVAKNEKKKEDDGEGGRLDASTMTTTTTERTTTPPRDFEYELVLRKWCNLHPSMEFRCFVYDKELGECSDGRKEGRKGGMHPYRMYSPVPSSFSDRPLPLDKNKTKQNKYDQWPYPSVIPANITRTCSQLIRR